MDCAVDDYKNDNFSDGPHTTIAGYAETRLPAPSLPPEFSAAGDRLGLKLLALFLFVFCAALFVFDDFRALGVATLFISVVAHLPFVVALVSKRARFIADPGTPIPDDALPVYSILVPVYHEANMMAQISRSLAAIDYPHDRLDALILIEADDSDTREAAESISWPPFVRLITVRADGPKTKPRACNFGLAHAFGSLVVIYDAEDQPHPRQLRDAATRFHNAPPDLACLQAPLVIDDHKNNWLAAMFALEYRLLFTRFLPVLANFGCVIPLGGTSNHFRADILRKLGAWDSHNLTEDADLGIRLAYFGYRTEMITPPTFENAPHGLKIFLRQRIRWQSGHIQTISVHLRQPLRACQIHRRVELCILHFGAFMPPHKPDCTYGGDWLFAHGIRAGRVFHSFIDAGFGICVFILFHARLSGAYQNRIDIRLFYLLSLPAYWLLIAPATLIALYRMARGEMGWMKTPHRPFRRRTKSRT